MYGKIIPRVINTNPRKAKPLTIEVKNEQRAVDTEPTTERTNRPKRKPIFSNKKEEDTDSI